MSRAIGSNVNIYDNMDSAANEYMEAVSDIIDAPEVRDLKNFKQHLNTDRFQHSLNVSYYSFKVAKFFKLDARSAARAGLLHDLYYYEFNKSNLSCKQHSSAHAEIALYNAMLLTETSSMEQDIILNHMWPLTKKAPQYKEGFVVTFADKGCALAEVFSQVRSTAKGKLFRRRILKAQQAVSNI